MADDYKGEHTAPDSDNAPMWDLRGTYPEDIYTSVAVSYYGSGRKDDGEAVAIIQGAKGRRDKQVRIFRAVPKTISQINKGDWVAITRSYAKEHGEDHLKGNFKIISKLVNARDLFTDGNSVQEWGYDPQPYTPNDKRDPKWERWPGFKKQVESRYSVVSKDSDFSTALKLDPYYEKIVDYVIGDSTTRHEEAPKIKDPVAATYKKKFDLLYKKAAAPTRLTLYRSHVSYDNWEVGDQIVLHGFDKLLSFTDSKEQALALAQTRTESDVDSGDYESGEYLVHVVLEGKAPGSCVYFHHKYDPKVAAHHIQEQEVLIDPNGLKFKIIATYSGDE
jgi:hypothetical protein